MKRRKNIDYYKHVRDYNKPTEDIFNAIVFFDKLGKFVY